MRAQAARYARERAALQLGLEAHELLDALLHRRVRREQAAR